ncbi:ead/Ea22-like family protein [Salmonella enterica subsp. enterica]|nr:ead/Ea22-like family protein [Salmonella enterica subsp. enterica]
MTIDKQALREAAEKAGKDKWQAKKINGDFYVIRSGSYIKQCGITSYQPIAEIDHKPVRDFVAMVNPATTLALLDENLQLQREKDAIEAEALALRDDMRQAREQLEAGWKQNATDVQIKARLCRESNSLHDRLREAEKRIAELEAKLETADKLQDSAFRDGLKAGFSYGQTDDQSGFAQCMSAYSTRAGIGVKQQEDSVDSDVSSRNQPGMVVAVHIDAGDFVKFKGQVFEVEETDFDDHDVTLWFVGGNTLKCAAGCQVEVVSAPVAAGIKVKGE